MRIPTVEIKQLLRDGDAGNARGSHSHSLLQSIQYPAACPSLRDSDAPQ